MRTIKGWLALGLALAMAACGGGGSDASIQISFTPSSLSIVSPKGVAGSQEVTASFAASGVTADNLFFGGEGGDVVVADTQLVSQTDTTITLRLIARADLAVGTYRDELRLLLCRNPACTSQYPGSPVRLPITYEVLPTLEVAPLLSATRSTAEPLSRVSTPITLPMPGLELQATVRDLGGQTSIFKPSVVNGNLVVDLDYAQVGFYQGYIDLKSVDGRYTATTVVNYQVLDGGNGKAFIAVEEPSLSLNLAQGQTVTRSLTVQPVNWKPSEVAFAGASAASGGEALVARTQVTPAGAGRFDLAIDTQGVAPGSYALTLTYSDTLGNTAFQSVSVDVGVNLSVDASSVALSSLAPAGNYFASAAVKLADGRNLVWQVDPATVPAWITLARTSGRTGIDPLTYTVDPAKLEPGAERAVLLSVSVPSAGLGPSLASVLVQDNLPRLQVAATPLLEFGQPAKVLLTGHFPEDITANGALEVSGATARISRRVNLTTLEVLLSDLTPGVPVQFRVRYPSFSSSASVDVKTAPTTTAPQVFPFGFGNPKPPVYSARHQSFYFVADGAIQRLAYQGGTWVRTSVAAPGVVDLDLDPDDARLVVLGFSGIDAHDPVSLTRLGRLRTFADFELGFNVPLSRLKNIGTTLDGQLNWIADGSTCAGRLQRVPLAQPDATPTEVTLDCNVTTSQASLVINRSRRFLTLYQADRGKQPVSMDVLTQRVQPWGSPLLQFVGIAATIWSDAGVLDNTGRYLYLSISGDSVSGGTAIPGTSGVYSTSVPPGVVVAGYGYRERRPGFLAYGYVRGTDGQGASAALAPRLLGLREDGPPPSPQDTLVDVQLPQPVGCLPGRPDGEPCDHRAHLLTDQSGSNVLILGPQAAIVMQVPEPAAATGLRTGTSIMKRRLVR